MKIKACVLLLFFVSNCFASQNHSISRAGDVLQIALPLSAVAITWMKEDIDQGGEQFALAFMSVIAESDALKTLVREKRPNGRGYDSFPSGHTARAFVSSSYLWRRYGYAYGIPATVLAGFVGYSRIEIKAHWWKDVVTGAALGMLANYFFTTPINVSVSKTSVAFSVSKTF